MPDKNEAQIDEAEKKVGAVLEDLEDSTQSDVEEIALADMVDTNPQTGKPEMVKGVDIQVKHRATRSWSR